MNDPEPGKIDSPKPDDAPQRVDSPKPADSAPTPPTARARLSKSGKVLIAQAVLAVVAVGGLYYYIVSGGMRARQEPWAAEAFMAHMLVDLSIPNDMKALKNPLNSSPGSADVAAGRDLYQKHCQVCHGFDGSGKTDAGVGLF